MKTQTLNRIIKASYYAPNGAQLRKACYGLLALNSRKASTRTKNNRIIQKGLIESSKRDRKKLEKHGLQEVSTYLSNTIPLPELAEKTLDPNPVFEEKIETMVKSPEDAIEVARTIVRARSYQEILSFLDIPIEKLQQNIEWNENRIRIDSVAASLAGLYKYIFNSSSIGMQIFLVIITKTIAYGVTGLLEYLFGDFNKWLTQNYGKILGYIVTSIPRIVSGILKTFGWALDEFVDFTQDIKNRYIRHFTRVAKIAMQSPEFRNAYYKLV